MGHVVNTRFGEATHQHPFWGNHVVNTRFRRNKSSSAILAQALFQNVVVCLVRSDTQCGVHWSVMADHIGELLLKPQCDFVSLDVGENGQQLLTHNITLRRQPVPSDNGPWKLVFDGDFGCIIGANGDTICLEDYLSRQLYTTEAGMMWVVEVSVVDGTAVHAHPWNLTRKMQTYEATVAKVSLDFGSIELPIYKLAWPRGSFHVCWEMQPLYRLLGLTTYKKEPSKWVYTMMPQWEQRLKELGLEGHFLHSNSGLSREQAAVDANKFLPGSSATTLAFVATLVRWAGCSARQGGLRSGHAKSRARSLLDGLVRGCLGKFSLTLSVTLAFEYCWPRPDVTPEFVLRLPVCDKGLVDVSSWAAIAEDLDRVGERIHGVLLDWFLMVQEFVTDDRIPLATFVCETKCFLDKEWVCAWKQIVWQVAHRLEVVMIKTRHEKDCEYPVQMAFVESSDDWSIRAVDRTCGEHVASCRAASDNQLFVGIAVDKVGGCRSLDLQNGFLVFPNNIAFELVPQVSTARCPT